MAKTWYEIREAELQKMEIEGASQASIDGLKKAFEILNVFFAHSNLYKRMMRKSKTE